MNDDLPCSDKAVFNTQAEANAASIVAEHQHGVKLKSYLCKYCNLWHLASNYDTK